ncbi:MAG: LmeA family phospholipid-binding protein [Mycobacteriales bacterium]
MTGPQHSTHEPAAPKANRSWPLPRVGRPATRTVVLALMVLLGTGLLAWGADWAARVGAQSLLARSIQNSTGTPARPSVKLHGAFFLPQVIRGRYGSVDIDLSDLSSGPLRINSLHASLTGVHLPFHDVLVRHANRIVIDGSQERISVSYADLNRYLALTARPLTVCSTKSDELDLTGSISVLGRTVSASATARLSAQQGALAIQATGVSRAGTSWAARAGQPFALRCRDGRAVMSRWAKPAVASRTSQYSPFDHRGHDDPTQWAGTPVCPESNAVHAGTPPVLVVAVREHARRSTPEQAVSSQRRAGRPGAVSR